MINHDLLCCSCYLDPERRVQLTQCRLEEKSRVVNQLKCEVKHTVDCKCTNKYELQLYIRKDCFQVKSKFITNVKLLRQ
jgi:hypothetical protein